MRKLVVTTFLSLDGVMENPAWTFPYWNDEIARFKGEETEAADALLLGRVTYEGFAASWPERTGDGAEFFNGVRKYVVSTTLDRADWNNSHLIKENVVEAIKALKAEEGQDILVYGSGELLITLMEHDLVDSYRLLVYPVVLGAGQRLFSEGSTATLKLTEARAMSSGVTALLYEPARG